jgi:hypothetical protein
MKKPKIKKPNLPKPSSRLFKRGKSVEERVSDAISNVPRITNDTVTDHREDVLSRARKYIYPLQHSKHKVVRISIGLLLSVVIGFLVVCSVDLYKLQGNSGFIYDVTKIIPFPVAKTGNTWISYESYLFELRRNMHYYITQQQANFSTKDGKAQLARLKEQSLNYAVQAALVKKLADQNGVTVGDQAVNNQVNLLRNENRLGSSDHVFKEVLSEYYGWSETDFKRELKEQMLQQAVVAKLDQGTASRASNALKQLKSGADFGTLASQVSDDVQTKVNGGQYPDVININDQQVSPIITNELFQLKPGQTSGIINTGFTLEIVKVIDRSGSNLHASHIQFNLQDINTYIKPIQNKQTLHNYIKV